MSKLIRVPKKLKVGMAVVFKLDSGWPVPYRDFYTVPTGKWLKGTIRELDGDYRGIGGLAKEPVYALFYNNYPIYPIKSKCLLIRSVALDDDQAQLNRRARMRAKYRAKALGK